MIMLNLTSMEKDKDVDLSLVHAAAQALNSMSFVLEVIRDVLHMVEEVDIAKVILYLIPADTTLQTRIMTVKMKMVKIMLDSLLYKYLEEQLAASASLVLSTQDHPLVVLLSVSSILALEKDHPLNLKSNLVALK